MIYFTHLLRDEEMREIVRNTGMGIESIEFSVSENLDKLQETMLSYEKRLSYMECESFTLDVYKRQGNRCSGNLNYQ